MTPKLRSNKSTKKPTPDQSISKESASWSSEETETFLALLKALPPKEIGDNGFKKTAWSIVQTRLNEEHHAHFSIEQLKNKYQALKTNYNIYHRLKVEASGLGLNTVEGIDADDEVWDDWIRRANKTVAKKIRQFRKKPFEYHDQMHELCAGLHATGEFARKAGEEDDVSDEANQSEKSSPEDAEEEEEDRSVEDHETEEDHTTSSLRRSASPFSAAESRKRSRSNKYQPSGSQLAEAVLSFGEIVKGVEKERRIVETLVHQAISRFQDRYEDDPEMDLNKLVCGIKVLTDRDKAGVFLSLHDPLRDYWIRSEIRNLEYEEALSSNYNPSNFSFSTASNLTPATTVPKSTLPAPLFEPIDIPSMNTENDVANEILPDN